MFNLRGIRNWLSFDMGKKFKKDCCQKFEEKGKRCSNCPLRRLLPEEDRKYKKREFRAALRKLEGFKPQNRLGQELSFSRWFRLQLTCSGQA
jgi:hypothetical protein